MREPQERCAVWEARLQLVFCYSSGDESIGLDLGEQRDRRRSVSRLPGFLPGVQYLLIAE